MTMSGGFERDDDTGALLVTGIGGGTPADESVGAEQLTPDLLAGMKGFVFHGADANVARPTLGFASYEWIGSVEPANWITPDTWAQTP